MAEKKHERYQDSLLYRVRHSTAHIMAQAVMEEFPEGKVAIGPAIEDGFYYDFELPRALTPDDLVCDRKTHARHHRQRPSLHPQGSITG